jgi:dihydroflavonol-4-reductase
MNMSSYLWGIPASALRMQMSLISVDECVDGIIRAFEHGKAGESYILSGQALSLGEIVKRSQPPGLWFGTVKLPLSLFRLMIRCLDMVGRFTGHVFYYNSEFLDYCTGGLVADSGKAARELGFVQRNFDEQFAAMVRGNNEEGK